MGPIKGIPRGKYIKPFGSRDTASCGICGKSYKRRQSVLLHIKSKHSNVKIDCSICDKDYSQISVYNRHLKKVSFVDIYTNQMRFYATKTDHETMKAW